MGERQVNKFLDWLAVGILVALGVVLVVSGAISFWRAPTLVRLAFLAPLLLGWALYRVMTR